MVCTDIGREMIENRKLFLSKRAVNSFGGYATQQLRRLENALARDKLPQARKEEHILNSMKNAVKAFEGRYRVFENGGTIRRFIQANGLAVKFPVGHSMNAEQREAWSSFLKGEVKSATTTTKPEEAHISTPDKNETMSMKRVSLSFSGKINAAMIVNSLLQILGENASGEVEITCQLCG